MNYMLLVYWNEAEHVNDTREQKAETFAAYAAYTEAMKQAGVFVSASGLQDSSTATVLRRGTGKPTVLNGPYAESKEQLAGYYLFQADDLDGALAWASRCPGVQMGSVEVRPLMVY